MVHAAHMRGILCKIWKGLAGACLWVEPVHSPVDSPIHVRKEIDLHMGVQDRPEQKMLTFSSLPIQCIVEAFTGMHFAVGAHGPNMHARDTEIAQ